MTGSGRTPLLRPTHMTQASTFGRSLGQVLHLKDAPSSLITRSMRGLELAFTESRNDNPAPGLSGSFIPEDAFLVSLKLHDYPDCELWGDGKCVMKADVPAGATYLYDLKHDPRYVINKPFHTPLFLSAALGARRARRAIGARRASASSPVDLGVGHDDAIIRHIGALAAGRTASAGRDQPAFHRSHDARAHRTCRPDLWRTAAK